MGRFISDLLGTLDFTFRVGPATFDASALTTARTYDLPDANGTIVVGDTVVESAGVADAGKIAVTDTDGQLDTSLLRQAFDPQGVFGGKENGMWFYGCREDFDGDPTLFAFWRLDESASDVTISMESVGFFKVLIKDTYQINAATQVFGNLPLANGGLGDTSSYQRGALIVVNAAVTGFNALNPPSPGIGTVYAVPCAVVDILGSVTWNFTSLTPNALGAGGTWNCGEVSISGGTTNGPMFSAGIRESIGTIASGTLGLNLINVLASGSFNLPASPGNGKTYFIRNTSAASITISRNGNNINGAATNLTLAANARVKLVYRSTGTSWWEM